MVCCADTTSDLPMGANAVSRLLGGRQFGCHPEPMAARSPRRNRRVRSVSVPFLTMSFSIPVIDRGYKYVFQVVATGSAMGKAQLAHTMEMAKLLRAPSRSPTSRSCLKIRPTENLRRERQAGRRGIGAEDRAVANPMFGTGRCHSAGEQDRRGQGARLSSSIRRFPIWC